MIRIPVFIKGPQLLGQLKSFIKDLIDKCGINGGLIIIIKMPDNTRIEGMQAMPQSIKEHGRYQNMLQQAKASRGVRQSSCSWNTWTFEKGREFHEPDS